MFLAKKGVYYMKKVLSFTMIVFLLLSVWGCAIGKDPGVELYRNEQFAVKEYNGERYLDFYDDSYRIAAGATNQTGGLQEGNTISFQTLKEMKDCIELGKFSEKDMITMQSFRKASNGKVLVCDTDKLFNVKLPENTNVKKIGWFGAFYIFVAENNSTTIRVNLVSKEERDEYIEKKNVESNSNLTVVSKEVDPVTGETVIEYDNHAFGYRSRTVQYTLTTDGGTVTFLEKYDYDKSETLPWGISFWGENAGGYFYGTISGFEEMPSREWLTAIAVVPYSENETT